VAGRPRCKEEEWGDSLAVIAEDTREMEGLADRTTHSPSGDYFEGTGYPLEDEVMTSDSAAHVDVGM